MFLHYICRRTFSTVAVGGRKRVRSKMDIELKCRENPVVIKLDSPEFNNLFSDEVKELKRLFDKYQFDIRIAGGAVRDLLMGLQPKDLDFATPATPQQMKDMFTTENVRLINESGEKHGTITPRINDKENFEVTTLRIDMITDGRHAEVEYTTDWKLDANRRDLTINSMFLGFDGSVYDYFFGYEDLQKKRVAFVGDPDVRIKEDYLRIMRYFRFYGRIAEEPNKHEESTLKVISNNVDGLKIISGERIWSELKKILQGKFAADLLKVMVDVGIGKYIGFPTSPNLEELAKFQQRAGHLDPHPMCYLAALLNSIDDVSALHARMKFSNFDRDLAYHLVEHRQIHSDPDRPLLPYEKLVLYTKLKQKDVIEFVREILKYKGDERLLQQFNDWQIPTFPINGKVLKDNNVPTGKMYGRIISRLKDLWVDGEYKPTTKELVAHLPKIIKDLNENKNGD